MISHLLTRQGVITALPHLDAPVLVHEQVGRLEVPVQDGRPVRVQLQQAL